MEADVVLADYASVDPNGKYTLVGAGITRINAPGFPWTHPSMFLLVRFQVTKNDKGRNRIDIRLLGEKGHVFKTEAGLDVSPAHEQEAMIPLSFHLQNTKFELPGEYHLEVLINGISKASQVLIVTLAQARPVEPPMPS